MLVNDVTRINIEEFKEVFEKKFTSFCEKAPLYLTYTIIGNKVEVQDMTQKEIWEKNYELDFSRTEKWNIKRIRDDLEKRYPVIPFKYVKQISDERATQLISEGYSISEVMTMSEQEEVNKYRVLKLLNDSNEIIVRNLENNEVHLLGVKVPLVNLADKIFSKNFDEVQKIFENKTYLKQVL